MRRKLVKQGKNALTVTLPADWVRSNELEPGDAVEVEQEENRILIDSVSNLKKIKSAEVEFESLDIKTWRSILGGFYRGGYDEIIVKYKNPKVLSVLQNNVDRMFGLEILTQSDNSCIIKSIYNADATEILPHVRKIIHIIKTMQKIILDEVKSGKYDSRKEMADFREGVVKQRDLVVRTIISRKLLSNSQFPYYSIVYNLWQMTREYEELYQYLSDNHVPAKDVPGLLVETTALFNSTFETLETHKLVEKYDEYERLKKESIRLLQQRKCALPVVTYCFNVLRNIQTSYSSLLLINFGEKDV